MTNKEAMETFLAIGIRANQMAEVMRPNLEKLDEVRLVHLMGELHNNQLAVENWLWELITHPTQSLPSVPD